MNEISAKKKFQMRVAIGSIALIILILWGLNLKNVWQNNRSQEQPSTEWQGLKADLEKTLAEARNKLDGIKKDKAMAEKEASDKFLEGLMDNTAKNASSSAVVATSSTPIASTSVPIATSTPKNSSPAVSNCPKYIDCMPTVGETKPCVIPLGCEGITLIAY